MSASTTIHPTASSDNPAATGRLLHDYGLSIVLLVLFAGSWVVQSVSGWGVYAADQAAHGEQATLLGQDGYVWNWLEATFENWQSEFLQLLTFVVLTSVLYHRGSHESRDGQEEQMAVLKRIEQRLLRLEEIGSAVDPAPAGGGSGRPPAGVRGAALRSVRNGSAATRQTGVGAP